MAGTRAGELVGLKFSDIDYSNNKITIERSAYKLAGEPVATKPPKDYEVRTITITPYCIKLIEMLKVEKEKTSERLGSVWNGGEWLFTKCNGEIMNPQTPTKQFSKFLKKKRI